MKEKLASIIFAILGIAAVLFGFYLLREGPLFALISFVGAIICAISSFQEYGYYKNRKVMVDPKSLPSEMIIRYSQPEIVISILGYSVFITLGIFFLSMIGLDYKKYQRRDLALLALATFFIISNGIKIFKILKKVVAPPVLVINSQGIVLDAILKMNWSDIKEEKITVKKEFTSKYNYKANEKYLSLFHQNKKIEEKIDKLDVADHILEQYLKMYRKLSNTTTIYSDKE